MALSYAKIVSDGVTSRYTIPFKYFDASHISVVVYERGEVIPFTVDTTTNEVVLNYTPPEFTTFYIRRQTPVNRTYSDFTRGNRFGEKSVNNSFLWQLYIAQELAEGGKTDAALETLSNLDMKGFKIQNLGAPKDPNDAVRLVDLYGIPEASEGVTIYGGDTYVHIPKAISSPDRDTVAHYFEVQLKAHQTLQDRTLFTSDGGIKVLLSASLKNFHIVTPTQKFTVDITELALPLNVKTTLTFETTLKGGVCEIRLHYGDKTTDWLALNTAKISFDRLMGGGLSDEGCQATVYKVTYRDPNSSLLWSFNNITTRVIPCSNADYTGTLVGDNSAPEEGGGEGEEEAPTLVKIHANAVVFNPEGSSYNLANRDVDKVLKEIDTTFYRKKQGSLDPDPSDPNTPMQPNTHWIVDTLTTARSRVLPLDSPIGATYLIRDGQGRSSVNPIKILRNGQRIMGRDSDLIINTNWAWCELMYEGNSNFVITSGGVGAKIDPDPLETLKLMMPVGYLYLSTDKTNPATIFGFGKWRLFGTDRAIVGSNGVAGGTFGSSRVSLTSSNIPEHQHDSGARTSYASTNMFPFGRASSSQQYNGLGGTGGFGNDNTTLTSKWGSATPTPINITPPSIYVNIFERYE